MPGSTLLPIDFRQNSPSNIWDNVVDATVVVDDIVLVVVVIGSMARRAMSLPF